MPIITEQEAPRKRPGRGWLWLLLVPPVLVLALVVVVLACPGWHQVGPYVVMGGVTYLNPQLAKYMGIRHISMRPRFEFATHNLKGQSEITPGAGTDGPIICLDAGPHQLQLTQVTWRIGRLLCSAVWCKAKLSYRIVRKP